MLNYYFTFLFILSLSTVSAGLIGPVEYCLPMELTEDWCIENTLHSPKSKTIVYVPKEPPKGEEFFEAVVNKQPTDLDDIEAFKAKICSQYSDMDVKVDILDKKNNNLLFEWIAKDNGHERIYGWGRIFSIGDETVILGYQTDDLSNIDQSRGQWLPALKEAKVMGP